MKYECDKCENLINKKDVIIAGNFYRDHYYHLKCYLKKKQEGEELSK